MRAFGLVYRVSRGAPTGEARRNQLDTTSRPWSAYRQLGRDRSPSVAVDVKPDIADRRFFLLLLGEVRPTLGGR